MRTKAILIQARARLADHWGQGTMRECALGAIYQCSRPDDSVNAPTALVEMVIGANLVSWNDAEGRTQAEVLAAFDKAIEAAS